MLLRAFAKINLDLRILGRRPDGYHEIRTILQTIDWCDEIHLDPAARFEFIAHGVEGGESNLVVRAVRAFEKASGVAVRARIELFKHVPVGAGLGGGSADAAVTLMGLQRLLERDLAQAEVVGALRTLGSDVPFFERGGRAEGRGRGDELIFLEDEPEYWLVVVYPGIFISSAEAYSWLTLSDEFNSIEGSYAPLVSGSAPSEPRNDFETAVFARHPVLSDIKNELLASGALRASLSGSGSAIFGIFGSQEAASRALPRVRNHGTSRVLRPLPRPEYLQRVWGVAKW